MLLDIDERGFVDLADDNRPEDLECPRLDHVLNDQAKRLLACVMAPVIAADAV